MLETVYVGEHFDMLVTQNCHHHKVMSAVTNITEAERFWIPVNMKNIKKIDALL